MFASYARCGGIGSWLPLPLAGEGWGGGCLRIGIVENCGGCPRAVRTLTRRALRVGLSRKRERRSKPAVFVKSISDFPAHPAEAASFMRARDRHQSVI